LPETAASQPPEVGQVPDVLHTVSPVSPSMRTSRAPEPAPGVMMSPSAVKQTLSVVVSVMSASERHTTLPSAGESA
jgi:hypothetical protein